MSVTSHLNLINSSEYALVRFMRLLNSSGKYYLYLINYSFNNQIMNKEDIRWQQRFNNFNKTFTQLEKFVGHEDLNELEKQGLIKAFEYTYELIWKTLQDLLKEKGYKNIAGPKPVIEQSFQDGYIDDGEGWMRMHISRNLTSHTYNEETAEEIVAKIKSEYFILFNNIKNKLEEEKSENKGSIFDE